MNPFGEPNSAEMAEEVENERAGLVNTLDQLRENLRPENVVDEVFSQAQANTSDIMDKIWAVARANPIPAALIGLGAAMLAGATRRPKLKADHRGTWAQFEDDLADPAIFDAAAGEAGGTSALAWSDPYPPMLDGAIPMRRSRPLSGLSRLIDEQPLLLAAVGIAAGAAIGAAIPSTDIESQWLGDASESMRHNANAIARDQLEQMRTTAHETLDGMKETVVRHGVSAENFSGLVHDLGDQAKKGAASFGQPPST